MVRGLWWLAVVGCQPDEVRIDLELDPSGYAPLSAELSVRARAPVTVSLRVPGDHGPGSDVVHTVAEPQRRHRVPVLGLYPDRAQVVEVTVFDAAGVAIVHGPWPIETPALPDTLHQDIEMVTADRDAMTPGMTLVSAFGTGSGPDRSPSRPLMFDAWGDVRWALDYASHPNELSDLLSDVGVERLANGHLYFGNIRSAALYEVDMLGHVVESWSLDPYNFHHQVQELPDGNFLVTASLRNDDTVQDHILEVDRDSGDIVEVWDLRQSLQPERATWGGGRDWIHVNAVAYDASDDTIVISGRLQGVVKLTRDNEVVWILAPHRGWGTAGDGTDLSDKLLQPVDASGQPIRDPALLDGEAAHPDFQWNWYQHAVEVLGDGEIALFDNGENRQFGRGGTYSRAVRYRIDEASRTVQQVWAYGEARGPDLYSRIVSDVDVLDNGHVIWSPGAIQTEAGTKGAVVELDASDHVVFEAYVWSDDPSFGITFHRTERLSLYP